MQYVQYTTVAARPAYKYTLGCPNKILLQLEKFNFNLLCAFNYRHHRHCELDSLKTVEKILFYSHRGATSSSIEYIRCRIQVDWTGLDRSTVLIPAGLIQTTTILPLYLSSFVQLSNISYLLNIASLSLHKLRQKIKRQHGGHSRRFRAAVIHASQCYFGCITTTTTITTIRPVRGAEALIVRFRQ